MFRWSEILDKGVIYLDKPLGPTSHQISCWVKDVLNVKKAGHVGTLDPNASGVLPILFGKATKLTKYLQLSDKIYVFLLDKEIDEDKLDYLKGKIYQKPPKESAVKKEIRVRNVYWYEIIEKSKNHTIIKAKVQHGTYIRSIVRDLSRLHGYKINMLDLRRIKSGTIDEEKCITFQKFYINYLYYLKTKDPKYLENIVHPIEDIMSRFKSVEIKKTTLKYVLHGNDIFYPGIIKYDHFNKNETICIKYNGKIVAIGKALKDWNKLEKRDKIIKVETVLGL